MMKSVKINYNLVLLVSFLGLLAILIAKGYVYTYVLADFPVRTYFSCDPAEHSCFTVDDEEFYTYGTLPAERYRICAEDESCDDACDGSDLCELEYCTEEAESDEEWCSTEPEPELVEEDPEEATTEETGL